MRFKNIIFDFDGTLVDSKPGIIQSFKKVMEELAAKKLGEEEIVRLIGLPLAKIISTLLNTNDKTIINQGSKLFKEYYNREGISQSIVYPGIKEMLANLINQSRQLFVVSNKIESFMIKILKQHDLERHFIFIRGTDGTDEHSEKTEYVKDILANYKLKKEETTIIGDTENDIIAGKENLIHTIGITWGYGQESDLVQADMICHTPSEIEQFV